MDQKSIIALLEQVKMGEIAVEDAARSLGTLSYEELGYAKIDSDRKKRTGYPEVIYCAGKTPEQVLGIIGRILTSGGENILLTRVEEPLCSALSTITHQFDYHKEARIIVVNPKPVRRTEKVIAVVTAGTSDLPVSEEAAVTCETFGNPVDRIYDVGVAGLHRLLAQLPRLNAANVIVIAAGMEGALASVVGGLVSVPVIAVPTSVGYGANFGGLSALLCMLNSCASGVGVVNIDNGFGAGYLASVINNN